MPTDVPYYLERPEGQKFSDLSDSLGDQIAANRRDMDAARTEQKRAREAEGAAIAKQGEAMRPPIREAQAALSAPLPTPPTTPDIAPPPSRKLTDFLAPVAGESPENTITKLIQGIGLMAAGITGLKRGDARAALAGLHGALKGWQEGDKERADRAFADWDAAAKNVIGDWERRHKVYRDLLENQKLTVDQRLEAVKLAALDEGHDVMVATLNRRNMDDVYNSLRDDRDQLMRFQEHADRLKAMHAEKESQRAFLQALQTERLSQKKADERQKAAEVDDLDKDTLRRWGKDYMLTRQLPSIGQGGKGQAVMIRTRVVRAGVEWARENGLDPMQFDAIRAEVAGDRQALITLKRNNANQEEALERLEPHLKTLIRLSDMVPRSEIPAVNAVIIRGQKDYKGSPEAAEYVLQAVEAAMEQARVQVPGSAQGDANSREEVRKTIAPELSPLQIRAVANRYLQNGRQSIEANRRKEKEISERIDTLGGRIQGPPMAPPPTNADPADPLGILKAKK